MMNENCVMVFVTPQKSCARLIEASAKIAESKSTKLMVISIVNNFDNKTTEALNELYAYVESLNASMNLYVNNEAFLTAAVAAKRFHATEIVTGFPGEQSSMFVTNLHKLLPDIPITMVDENGVEYKMIHYTKEQLDEFKSGISLT